MSEYNNRVEEVLDNVTQAGRYKFMIHSVKGSWGHKSQEVLLDELSKEVEELKEAILQNKGKEAIASEIGDVVNYAAMLLEKVLNR